MAVLQQLETPNCSIVAVDSSAAMLERARALHGNQTRIEWVHADVRDVPIENACAVLMNYTLQFVPGEDRLPLLQRIREGLDPSGVLIVSEKVRFADEWQQSYFEHTHVAYKRANGYSALEVAQKRTRAREGAHSGSHRRPRSTLSRGRVRSCAHLVPLPELGVVRRDVVIARGPACRIVAARGRHGSGVARLRTVV